jgi:hypothetical protein
MMIAALEQANRELDEKDKKIAALEQENRELRQLRDIRLEEEIKAPKQQLENFQEGQN